MPGICPARRWRSTHPPARQAACPVRDGSRQCQTASSLASGRSGCPGRFHPCPSRAGQNRKPEHSGHGETRPRGELRRGSCAMLLKVPSASPTMKAGLMMRERAAERNIKIRFYSKMTRSPWLAGSTLRSGYPKMGDLTLYHSLSQ